MRRRDLDCSPADKISAFDGSVERRRIVREPVPDGLPGFRIGKNSNVIPPKLDTLAAGFQSHQRLNVSFGVSFVFKAFEWLD